MQLMAFRPVHHTHSAQILDRGFSPPGTLPDSKRLVCTLLDGRRSTRS
jgi:hypothetical protein